MTMALIRTRRRDTTAASSSRPTAGSPASRAAAIERPHAYHFIGVQVAEARAFAGSRRRRAAETVNWLYPRLIADNPRAIAALRLAGHVPRHRHAARLPRDVARDRRGRRRTIDRRARDDCRRRGADAHGAVGRCDRRRRARASPTASSATASASGGRRVRALRDRSGDGRTSPGDDERHRSGLLIRLVVTSLNWQP